MRARAEVGFTLVEALVAMAILSLTVVAALETAARTIGTQAAAARHLEAVALADGKMNALAALPADQLPGHKGSEAGTTQLGSRSYLWRSDLRRSETGTGLWIAEVHVSWDGGEFGLETLLYRPTRADRLRGR